MVPNAIADTGEGDKQVNDHNDFKIEGKSDIDTKSTESTDIDELEKKDCKDEDEDEDDNDNSDATSIEVAPGNMMIRSSLPILIKMVLMMMVQIDSDVEEVTGVAIQSGQTVIN